MRAMTIVALALALAGSAQGASKDRKGGGADAARATE